MKKYSAFVNTLVRGQGLNGHGCLTNLNSRLLNVPIKRTPFRSFIVRNMFIKSDFNFSKSFTSFKVHLDLAFSNCTDTFSLMNFSVNG